MSAIPLHCNICPKKPKFSDVSHLLTHIASKGHLSHYYKVKVRSSTEEECRVLIEAYDQWYSRYKVEDLMSERMNLKDKRRSRALKSQAAITRNSSLPRGRPMRRDTPVGHDAPADPRLPDSRADPRTSMSQLSHSYPQMAHQHSMPQHPSQMVQPRHHHSHSQGMMQPHYHTTPHHHHPQAYFGTPPATINGAGMSHSRPYAPCMVPPSMLPQMMDHPYKRRRSEVYDDHDSEETFSTRSFSIPDSISLDQFDGCTEDAPECAKLKGVFWPGMDIFDSATPEMKRKRNQKKDTSVVEQLEANSLDVEPMEMIFTPLGTLKKARKISGNPDEDETSPIRGDTSPLHHSQYPGFSRPPLMAIPFDVSRLSGNPSGNLSANPFDSSRAGMHSISDDRGMMDHQYGMAKRKRPYELFQEREVLFNSPSGFGLLNSEFHLPTSGGQTNSLPSEHARYEYRDQASAVNYDPFQSHPPPPPPPPAEGPQEDKNNSSAFPSLIHHVVKVPNAESNSHFPCGTQAGRNIGSYQQPAHSFSYSTADYPSQSSVSYGNNVNMSYNPHMASSSNLGISTYSKTPERVEEKPAGGPRHVKSLDPVGADVC